VLQAIRDSAAAAPAESRPGDLGRKDLALC
jgi:hypothetical protein